MWLYNSHLITPSLKPARRVVEGDSTVGGAQSRLAPPPERWVWHSSSLVARSYTRTEPVAAVCVWNVQCVGCVLVTIMSNGGSLVPSRRAAEATHRTTVIADQFLWRLTLKRGTTSVTRQVAGERWLTVCEAVMSTFQMAPAASCAYHRVGVSGSGLRHRVFRLTS